MKYKRQRQQYLFAGALGVIAIVNLLFFVILYRPVSGEYYRLQDSIQRLRAENQQQQQEAARLENLSAQLEGSDKDKQRLYTTHFIPRHDGFAAILPKLDAIAGQAGVHKTRVDYAIDETPRYGLYSVKMKVPVTGGYSNVVNFIRDLEHSDTFFIINAIDIRGVAGSPGADIGLAMQLETFFYQP